MSDPNVPLAIVGLGCRLPGDASNPSKFWDLLENGRDAHSETSSRWNSDAFYHPNKNTLNTIPTRGGHFVKGDVYAFDAAFFNIPAAEAFAMDPRQRMTLEVVYEAFESAGMPLEKVKGGQTAVYVGAGTFDYQGVIQSDPAYAPKYTLTGISHEVLANRISHYFDLHGPSMTVETACSSSLVAIHLACQSLRNGEADMAVAGGINLILQPEMTMQLSNLGFLSQFGHCRSFDEAGDGYGRGEGCGFVVLKRLADAERDGDPIRAVVRGSGVNSDGWTQGITLPSATAQAALIRDVYKASGLDMDSTQYVECHGTGTKVGDPIEVQAIHETLGQTATPSRRLIIGSVKPNIGHLEAGAAVSGLIKGVLAMERGMIPPQIYLDTLNTKIPFDEWNIAVPRKLTPWPVVPVKRMSLSSFGMGGTNAHIILEGVDKRKGHPLITKNKLTNGFIAKERILDKKRLFTFSAFDQAGLERVAKTLADHLDSLGSAAFDPSYLANLAYTLGEGRSRLSWKTTCFAEHGHELREKLDGLKGGSAVRSNTQPRICYVFTGQGAQWAGMGVELLDRKVFGSSVAKSVQYLHEYGCEWDVVEELRRPAEKSRLGQPHISQPICTVLQIALVDELKSWGINPLKCVGHSSGEIGAAYAVGTLSHKHAIAIAYFRGQASSLIKETRPDLEGGMMAVGMSREDAEDWISKVDLGKVSVACVNSPESVTISGDVSGLDQLLPMLEAEKIFARKLKVGVAYHSHHMNEVMSEYLADIADIEVLRPAGEAAQMISSVTGSLVDPEDLGPYYWVRKLVSPVEFADALIELVTPAGSPSKDVSPANTVDLIIELGPHSALGGPIQQILGAAGIKGVSYAAALKRGHDGLGTVFKLAADLFIKGAPLNVQSVNEDDNCKVLVDLPPYPWNHSKTFNAESRMSIDNHTRKQPRKSLIGAPMPMTDEDEHVWRSFLSLEDEPWIRDHKLNSMVLFPAAGLLSMVLQAAQQMTDPGKVVRGFKMRDVTFMTAMLMNEDIPTEVILHIRPHIVSTAAFNPHTWWEFTIASCIGRDQSLRDNCRGLMMIDYTDGSEEMKAELAHTAEQRGAEYKRVLTHCPDTFDKAAMYEAARKVSWFFGPLFQTVDNLHPGKEKCTYDVFIQDCGPTYSDQLVERPYLIHPATLDAVFQSQLGTTYTEDKTLDLSKSRVPTAIGEFEIAADIPADVGTCFKTFCTSQRQGFKDTVADVYWLDESLSKVYASVRGYCSTEVSSTVEADVGRVSETSNLCTAAHWDFSLDLLEPEEMKAILAATASPIEATRRMVCIILHADPSLTVLELLADADTSNSIMSSVLKTPSFPGQLRYAIAGPQGGAVANAFYLGDAETSVPPDVAAADLIVVSPLCECVEGFSESLKKMLSLAKPKATVVCTANMEISQPILFDVGYSSKLCSGMYKIPAEVTANGVKADPEVVIVTSPNDGGVSKNLAFDLMQALAATNHAVKVLPWDESIASAVEGKSVISLMEVEKPFLDDLSEDAFASLQGAILKAKRLLWLTLGDDPVYNMIDGLARVVRGEVASVRLDVLHLSAGTGLGHGASLAARVLQSTSKDTEFRECNGAITVGRLSLDHKQNTDVDHHLRDWTGVAPLIDHAGPRRLTIGKPGLLDTLHFVRDNRWLGKPLGEREVEIQVKASGVNFRDVMSSMGMLNDSFIGLEIAGVVQSVGNKVSRLKAGDRVAACCTGAHATLLRTHEVACAKIPDDMTFETAAALSVVHTTAYHALVNLAKLRKGQSILIHAAAGGVGQAAIQLAKHLGLVVYATVGSEQKRRLLIETYGVHPGHIFYSRDTSFVLGIKRVTNGRGVDCILNSLSGELLRQSWHCLANFGTFIEIGLRDIVSNTRLDMRPFMQNATFTFFNLLLVMQQMPDVMGEIFTGVYDLVRRGILTAPSSLTTFPVGEVEDAFRLMQSGRHLGKLVLSMGAKPEVQVLHEAASSLKLDPNVTYLLVGGLGGLGRSLAGMFVDSGARNIAFVSRSGDDGGAEAKKAIAFLKARPGVSVKAYKADIADKSSLENAMAQCEAELPPVKGVVQLAMVLRDALFETMTCTDWNTALRPKVRGTRNLHEYFGAERPLDFMMFLSSCAGVFGNQGQANYAAGNTYQDELATYRRSKGLKAVSVDLGIMQDVGVVAETGAKGFLAVWEKAIGIHEPVFHALMRSIINGQTGPGAADFPAQIITGLPTADIMLEHGLPRPYLFDDPRMAPLALATVLGGGANGAGGGSGSIESRLNDVDSVEAAAGIITEALVQKTADMLQMEASEVDPTRPLYLYGIDSLVAIELRN